MSAFARERPELAALFALLTLGLILRIYTFAVWRPALTGFSDSGIYFQGVEDGVWSDPIRTVGYAMFLTVLHWITPHLALVTAVQHLMGLGAAAVSFFTVRRIGGPPWLGLFPAAVLALGGAELLIEHSALSETLYILLLSVALYCAVRAQDEEGWGWAAATGVCLGLSVWVRAAGVVLLLVFGLWLLLATRRPGWSSIVPAAVSLLIAIATVGVYLEWRQLASGESGLTTNGNWNIYGRVAPWADCTRFDPPNGTDELCESVPPSERVDQNDSYYMYATESPGLKLLGPSYLVSSYPDAMNVLEDWSLAAVKGQPGDYLDAVWNDTIRLIDSDHPSYGESSADDFFDYLINGIDRESGPNDFVAYWQDQAYPDDTYADTYRGNVEPLRSWERLTRFDGPLMVILLMLCLVAPWAVRGEPRSGVWLLVAVTLTLILFPLFFKAYDYRYLIPVMAPLVAAAAFGGWGLAVRWREFRSP